MLDRCAIFADRPCCSGGIGISCCVEEAKPSPLDAGVDVAVIVPVVIGGAEEAWPHSCSPIDDIRISAPHIEHLMAGNMLAGLSIPISISPYWPSMAFSAPDSNSTRQ